MNFYTIFKFFGMALYFYCNYVSEARQYFFIYGYVEWVHFESGYIADQHKHLMPKTSS